MHLSIFHRCTFLKQLSAAGSFLWMLTWLLSAQTHPGWGAPVAVKRSPALILACITRGGIWSDGGLASPVLGLYWWCEILLWRQPEINTSVYFKPDVSGLPWIQHHTLFSFFPAVEWNTCLDSYYHLLIADFPWDCLAPPPSEVQSTFFGHEGTWVCQKTGCLGESLPALGGMLITVKDAAHITPTSL